MTESMKRPMTRALLPVMLSLGMGIASGCATRQHIGKPANGESQKPTATANPNTSFDTVLPAGQSIVVSTTKGTAAVIVEGDVSINGIFEKIPDPKLGTITEIGPGVTVTVTANPEGGADIQNGLASGSVADNTVIWDATQMLKNGCENGCNRVEKFAVEPNITNNQIQIIDEGNPLNN